MLEAFKVTNNTLYASVLIEAVRLGYGDVGRTKDVMEDFCRIEGINCELWEGRIVEDLIHQRK